MKLSAIIEIANQYIIDLYRYDLSPNVVCA